jgi:hypothetical protein
MVVAVVRSDTRAVAARDSAFAARCRFRCWVADFACRRTGGVLGWLERKELAASCSLWPVRTSYKRPRHVVRFFSRCYCLCTLLLLQHPSIAVVVRERGIHCPALHDELIDGRGYVIGRFAP